MCTCHKCGRKYRVDILVDNDIWDLIRPDKSRPLDSGILCGMCITQALEKLGKYGSYTLITNPTNKERIK